MQLYKLDVEIHLATRRFSLLYSERFVHQNSALRAASLSTWHAPLTKAATSCPFCGMPCQIHKSWLVIPSSPRSRKQARTSWPMRPMLARKDVKEGSLLRIIRWGWDGEVWTLELDRNHRSTVSIYDDTLSLSLSIMLSRSSFIYCMSTELDIEMQISLLEHIHAVLSSDHDG